METTQAILNELKKALGDQYEKMLADLPMKKQVRECLVDGYRQGLNDGVRHVCGMLEIKVHS